MVFGMYLHEYLGARRLFVGMKAVELLHLVFIRARILARPGRGVVAFGMHLHEYFRARRLLVGAKAMELLQLVYICARLWT